MMSNIVKALIGGLLFGVFGYLSCKLCLWFYYRDDNDNIIKQIYHALPMWVWEILILIGVIGLLLLMVMIGLALRGSGK